MNIIKLQTIEQVVKSAFSTVEFSDKQEYALSNRTHPEI
jgi:hypothetical protein